MVRTVVHISAQAGPVETEIRDVPLEVLRLDPDNVRFRQIPSALSDAESEEAIWAEPETKDLFRSIVSAGGLQERPFVTSDYVVKEGNRRVVCLRKARELMRRGNLGERLPDDAFDTVQVEVFDEGITPDELDVALAVWHVTGKKEWRAINQANHIYRLHSERGYTYDQLRESIGMGKAKLIRMCKAYEATTNYLKTFDDTDIRKYSFFDELYKSTKLRRMLDGGELILKQFNQWVYEGKFDDSGAKDARRLPEVLNDHDARAAFEKPGGGIVAAVFELQKKNPALGSRTFKAVEDALRALREMPRHEYESIARYPRKLQMLEELRHELETIFRHTQDRS